MMFLAHTVISASLSTKVGSRATTYIGPLWRAVEAVAFLINFERDVWDLFTWYHSINLCGANRHTPGNIRLDRPVRSSSNSPRSQLPLVIIRVVNPVGGLLVPLALVMDSPRPPYQFRSVDSQAPRWGFKTQPVSRTEPPWRYAGVVKGRKIWGYLD